MVYSTVWGKLARMHTLLCTMSNVYCTFWIWDEVVQAFNQIYELS